MLGLYFTSGNNVPITLIAGEKSDDKDLLSYGPSLFTFTKQEVKERAEKDVERWSAAKQRRLSREESVCNSSSNVEENDDEVFVETKRNISTETDVTMTEITALQLDNQSRQAEVSSGYPTREQLQEDKKLSVFYTGIPHFTVLSALFEFVIKALSVSANSKLSPFDSFIFTLMKLRLNLPNQDLAFQYQVSTSTVCRVFKKWIIAMHHRLGPHLIQWPSHEALQRTMPFCFRVNYGLKVTGIIDCFELFIEKPSGLLVKACTWSQYKHYNTAKYLICISPQGVITFISKGWGGCTSDKYITEHSGFLRYLKHAYGYVILADRGFNVEECLGAVGASLHIPSYTRGRNQLSPLEIEKTRNIANVCIHVECVIGAVRQRFSIMSATGVLPKELFQQKGEGDVVILDAIVTVCCGLNNLCEGIVPFE